MSEFDTSTANLRVETNQDQLDDVLLDFGSGEPSNPVEYQRAVNDLCKALLALDDTGGATH